MTEKKKDKALEQAVPDLSAEFAELGRAMRNALDVAWNSQERQHLQNEIRSGLNKLADEMEAAARNIRQSEIGQQVEVKAKQVQEDIKSGKVTEDMRLAVAQVLRTARDALDRVAESFTPVEERKVEFDPIDMDRGKGK